MGRGRAAFGKGDLLAAVQLHADRSAILGAAGYLLVAALMVLSSWSLAGALLWGAGTIPAAAYFAWKGWVPWQGLQYTIIGYEPREEDLSQAQREVRTYLRRPKARRILLLYSLSSALLPWIIGIPCYALGFKLVLPASGPITLPRSIWLVLGAGAATFFAGIAIRRLALDLLARWNSDVTAAGGASVPPQV